MCPYKTSCCVDQFCSIAYMWYSRLYAKLELQILKVGRFSIGWFMLAARLVRAHLYFCTSWGQIQWFLLRIFLNWLVHVSSSSCKGTFVFLYFMGSNTMIFVVSPPRIIFARQANECLTTLSLTVFTQRNFVADFLQAKCDHQKRPFCVIEWGHRKLGATYDVHLKLIWKRVVDFLLVLIELFFARCYG